MPDYNNMMFWAGALASESMSDLGDTAISINHVVLGLLEVDANLDKIAPNIPTGELRKHVELVKSSLVPLGITCSQFANSIRSQIPLKTAIRIDGPTIFMFAPGTGEMYSKAQNLAAPNEPGLVHFLTAAMYTPTTEITEACKKLGLTSDNILSSIKIMINKN
jgi:hypothetical protein